MRLKSPAENYSNAIRKESLDEIPIQCEILEETSLTIAQIEDRLKVFIQTTAVIL